MCQHFFIFCVVSLSVGVHGLSRESELDLSYDNAMELASLPLECYNRELPYITQIIWNSTDDLQVPKYRNPIFYGCFDWYASVHGHWLLAALLKKFPDTELAEKIIPVFDEQFQASKAEREVVFLKSEKTFGRTYGWSWFLKLHQELLGLGKRYENHNWSSNLQPIADHFVEAYKDFLPKLTYASNTAFGLIFSYEYANYINDTDLVELIVQKATSYYKSDQGCPLNWEPNGFDFLSPCLQEADLMSRMAANDHFSGFEEWFAKFLPQLKDEKFELEPGIVDDRTDYQLVNLDGLNFSRAYNFYSLIINLESSANSTIALKQRMMKLADKHILQSIDYVVGSDYAGSHWLATYLTYAFQKREEALKVLQ